MRASIEASIQGAASSGELKAGATYVTDLENSRVSAYGVGGDASLALGAVTDGFQGLRAFLTEGGTIGTGEPISYVVRSLAHPDQTVKIGLALEYDAVDCELVTGTDERPLFHYAATDAGVVDTKLSGHHYVVRCKNLFSSYPTALGDALAPNGSDFGCLRLTGVLAGYPVFVFRAPTTVDGKTVDRGFQFSGNNFANGDYTVITVAKPKYTEDERFIWGSGNATSSQLVLGVNTTGGDNYLWMYHGLNGGNLAAPATSVALDDDYRVYTYRFSRTEGMKIYLNGVLIGSQPSATTPLASFAGAMLGTELGNQILMPEIQAYGSALSEDRMTEIVNGLMQKYAL
jgi:hypothetical protein